MKKIKIDGIEYKLTPIKKINLLKDTQEYLVTADFGESLPNKLMCQFSEHFDPERFNWEHYSHFVAQYCPQHFDPNRFNWEEYSYYVARYCPQFLKHKPE